MLPLWVPHWQQNVLLQRDLRLALTRTNWLLFLMPTHSEHILWLMTMRSSRNWLKRSTLTATSLIPAISWARKSEKEDTLGILEAIVEKRADFHQWGPFSDIEIMDWEGFVPDMQDKNYTDQLKARMNDRVNEIKAFATEKEGYDKLPDDALAAIQKVVDELK